MVECRGQDDIVDKCNPEVAGKSAHHVTHSLY